VPASLAAEDVQLQKLIHKFSTFNVTFCDVWPCLVVDCLYRLFTKVSHVMIQM
jgi:hypothetical protein